MMDSLFFQMNLPSGARIQIDSHTWGMNVHATAPSSDFQKTGGLCGTFDDNAENDYLVRYLRRQGSREEFVDSWR